MVDLGRLEVGRDEDVGRQPDRGRGGGRRAGEVAGRGAGERRDAELDGAGRGDRDGPVLEAQRRIARVVLEPEPVDAEDRGQPVRVEQRRGADRQRPRRRRVDGEQLQVAPDARRAPRDRLARQRGRDHGQVVGHLERPETGRTDIGEGDRLGEAAVATGHADEARGCGVGRRAAVVVVGGVSVSVVMAWSPGVRGVARRGDRTDGTSLIASRGLRRVPLSRRRTCPELAPCRHRAGRLSWLQRAGPSATLDKRSSVVGDATGGRARVVKAMPATRRDGPAAVHRAQPSRDRTATSTVRPCTIPRNATVEADSCGARHGPRITRGRSIRDVIARARGVRPLMATTHPARPDHPPTPGAGRIRPPLGRRLRANRSSAELYEDAIRAGEGLHRRRGSARRPHRQAHRSLAPGQVHRRRADEPRQDLVGRGQPADQRGALRPAPGAPRRLLRREGPLRPGPASSARTRPTSAGCASTPRRPGRASSRATCSAGRRAEDLVGFEPNFTIICVPSFKADPATEGTRTETAILVHLERMEIIIVGTEYAGEIKKSAFTVMNYLMPDEGVLPMHSLGQRRRGRRLGRLLRPVAAPARRRSRPTRSAASSATTSTAGATDGLFNFEGGCYAKTIRLSPMYEPDIFQTTRRFGTVLENVDLDPDTRELDLDSERFTENTRGAYPLHFIGNADPTGHDRPAADRRAPDGRRVRRPAADRAPDPRAGRLPLHQRLHGQARRHRGRRQGAEGHVLRLLRGAVHAPPPGRVRRDADRAPRARRTPRSGS